MNKPSDTIVDEIAPIYDLGIDLPVKDSGLRNVAHSEMRDTLRLPRSGAHDVTLVGGLKYYDGSGGGEAGHYVMLFVEFRAASSRWRTAGVKIRAVEAPRIIKHLRAAPKWKASAPGKNEDTRVGGKITPTDNSGLHGSPVPDGYLIFVKYTSREREYRTRGVCIQPNEAVAVAALLDHLDVERW
jgi:hypothetical protein